MTNARHERLSLLVEEAAEVQQISMKIMRHGWDSWNPFDENQTSNRELLEGEIGDLLFTIDFLIERGDLNKNSIAKAKENKKQRIGKYLHHNTTL
jgi:hypothetical protein